MNDWEPRPSDIRWLETLLAHLTVGGVWIAPAYGVSFKKLSEDHISVNAVMKPISTDAIDMIEKTQIVGRKLGIQVDAPKQVLTT